MDFWSRKASLYLLERKLELILDDGYTQGFVFIFLEKNKADLIYKPAHIISLKGFDMLGQTT